MPTSDNGRGTRTRFYCSKMDDDGGVSTDWLIVLLRSRVKEVLPG